MANQGRSNRQTVEVLISDINRFIDDVSDETGRILSESDRLAGDWQDPQYQEFMGFVEDLANQLGNHLQKMDEVVIQLERMLAKYD